MNKEIIEDWLKDIATPTGVSYSGDQTISESMVEEIVSYVEELEQQCKKQREVIDMFLEKVDKNKKLLNNPELLDLYLKIKEV